MTDRARASQDLARALARSAIARPRRVGVPGLLLSYFRPALLFLDTHDGAAATRRRSSTRSSTSATCSSRPGNPQGWDLGNFAGYAPYQFYFLPPSLLIVVAVVRDAAERRLQARDGRSASSCCRSRRRSSPARDGLLGVPDPRGRRRGAPPLPLQRGELDVGRQHPEHAGRRVRAQPRLRARRAVHRPPLSRHRRRHDAAAAGAVLLALAGLCHPVAFLNAAAPGLFFLLDRKRFARTSAT